MTYLNVRDLPAATDIHSWIRKEDTKIIKQIYGFFIGLLLFSSSGGNTTSNTIEITLTSRGDSSATLRILLDDADLF